jgi:hypothetical protein
MVKDLVAKDSPEIMKMLKERGLFDRSVVDSLEGKIVRGYDRNYDYIKIGSLSFGMSVDRDMIEIEFWVHEFTEAALTYVLLDMVILDGATLELISKSAGDIFIKGADGIIYNPTIKHIIASLCTESGLGDKTITGDEFEEMFLVKPKKPVHLCMLDTLFNGIQIDAYKCKHCQSNGWLDILKKYIKEPKKDDR